MDGRCKCGLPTLCFRSAKATASALDGPRVSNGYLGGALVCLIDVDGQAGMCLWLIDVGADVLVGADNVSHFSQTRVRSESLCVSKGCVHRARMVAAGGPVTPHSGGAARRRVRRDHQAGMCLWLNDVGADVLVGADNVSHFSQTRVGREILCGRRGRAHKG